VGRVTAIGAAEATVACSAVGEPNAEIRIELPDRRGARRALGLARIAWAKPGEGMRIEILSLGIDPALIAELSAPQAAAEQPVAIESLAREPAIPRPAGEPEEPFSELLVVGQQLAQQPLPAPAPERASTSRSVRPRAKRPSPVPVLPKGPPPLPARAKGPPPLPPRAVSTGATGLDEDEPISEVEPLVVRRTGVIIGIDLGTTNTCASHVVDGRPRVIPGRTGTNTIPSVVTFDPDGTCHVGQRAADRQVLHPLRTVYGSKRLLGRTYRGDLAAQLQRHFAYPLGEAEGQRFGLRLDDRVVGMEAIASRLLREVRENAEAHLRVPVQAAVITVPAYFTDVQREAVRRAAREADIVVHRIVNEPTAAAVAYGRNRPGRARIAVWDFGGGTFDFSVVDVAGGRFEVVATGGDCFLGGSDFDDLLASHLLDRFQLAERVDLEPDPQQIARLRDAAEAAKRSLSSQTEHLVEIRQLTRAPVRTLRVEITRRQFEQLTRPLVTRAAEIASEVLRVARLSPGDVDDVLLVGGTTRIPAVQKAVSDLFQRRPSKHINPDEAVALGAALLAEEIGSSNAPILLDVLPMSVGYGAPGLRFEPLVARNARLPVGREVTLAADPLGTAALHIFQGESPDVSRNEYICSATVEDASLRRQGGATFRLFFDEYCVMEVDARNARTRGALAVRLDRSRPVDQILRELGEYSGRAPRTWRLPESRLGTVLGNLTKLDGT
jgi:molecular chaperone DnaK